MRNLFKYLFIACIISLLVFIFFPNVITLWICVGTGLFYGGMAVYGMILMQKELEETIHEIFE